MPPKKSSQQQAKGKAPIAAWIACAGAMMVLAFMFGMMVGDGGAADPPPPAPTPVAAATTTDSSLLAKQSSQPPVQVTPSSINLGSLARNQQVPAEAEIHNIGREPLRIQSSRANCGCTTVNLAGTVIQPGQSVPLKATFNSQNQPGPKNSTVTVMFENFSDPVQVQISAIVEE